MNQKFKINKKKNHKHAIFHKYVTALLSLIYIWLGRSLNLLMKGIVIYVALASVNICRSTGLTRPILQLLSWLCNPEMVISKLMPDCWK